MGGLTTFVKVVVTRVLLILHAIGSIWRASDEVGRKSGYCMLVGLILLILEAIFVIFRRKGEELKWFSVCTLFYLASVVPAVWVLEIDRKDRFHEGNQTNEKVGLSEINGFTISIELTPDDWLLVIEQTLLLLLIVIRWLLPRGRITYDELSQLLYVYIGIASDILELFELFREPDVLEEESLFYAILVIYTVSLLQFNLVLTVTRKKKKRQAVRKEAAAEADNKDQEPEDKLEHLECTGWYCCETEIWAILVTMLLQDLPFFIVRMYAMCAKNIFSYSILFFTCKNGLLLSVQLYRLSIIHIKVITGRRLRDQELHKMESRRGPKPNNDDHGSGPGKPEDNTPLHHSTDTNTRPRLSGRRSQNKVYPDLNEGGNLKDI